MIGKFVENVKIRYITIPILNADNDSLLDPEEYEGESNRIVIRMHEEFTEIIQAPGNLSYKQRIMFLKFNKGGSARAWSILFQDILWDRFVDGVENSKRRNILCRKYL